MTLIVIEINDFKLTVHDKEDSSEHCAYAYIEKEGVIFGEKALSNIKLSPDDFHSHYWQRLGYEKINNNNQQIRHFADLAYLQLSDITKKYEDNVQVVFIVPCYYKEQQLALLLGLATSCKLHTLALINHDIINIEKVDYKGDYCVGQLGLHSSNLSHITIDQSIEFKNTKTFPELGFLELVSFISNWCNQNFIKHLRFDSLHSAHTEQALFDQVYKTLSLLSNTGTLVDQNILINEKSIKIEKIDFIDKISEFYSDLFGGTLQNKSLHCTAKLYNLISNTQYKHQGKLISKVPTFDLILKYLPFINEQSGICLLDKVPTLKEYKNSKVKKLDIPTHIICNQFCVAFKGENIYLNETKNSNHPFSRKQSNSSYIAITPSNNHLKLTVLKDASIKVNKSLISQSIILNCGDTISNLDQLNLKLIIVDEEF